MPVPMPDSFAAFRGMPTLLSSGLRDWDGARAHEDTADPHQRERQHPRSNRPETFPPPRGEKRPPKWTMTKPQLKNKAPDAVQNADQSKPNAGLTVGERVFRCKRAT